MHLLNLSKTLGELGLIFQIRRIFFFARWFYTLFEHKFSNLRPLLSITFAQGFLISKKLGHWTLGSGGKKTFKRSEQMKKKKIHQRLVLLMSFEADLEQTCSNLRPLPKVQCPNFLDIRNPWAKVLEISGLKIWKLLLIKGVKSPRKKKFFFQQIWPSSPSVLDKFNKCMP